MNPIVKAFNEGFGNCIFMNREPEYIQSTIMNEVTEHQFMETPVNIVVTPVDDLHDKLSLELKDGKVEGILSWHKSITGAHYVLNAQALELIE